MSMKTAEMEKKIEALEKRFSRIGTVMINGGGQKIAEILSAGNAANTENAENGQTETGSAERENAGNGGNVIFEGAHIVLNDKADIEALSAELAGMTRRRQRGKGMR